MVQELRQRTDAFEVGDHPPLATSLELGERLREVH
jgi:hypothetical protein